VQWSIISAACAFLGFVFSAWNSYQHAQMRAAQAELKVELIDRISKESERLRDLVDPLGKETAAAGARLGAVEDEVHRLTAADSSSPSRRRWLERE